MAFVGHMFYKGLHEEKHEKNLLVWNHKAKSFDILNLGFLCQII